MKLLKLAAPLLIAAALCGCSSTGLGDKVIVKALLLDYHQYEYLAQVLVLELQPSADAGEAAETIRLIEGSGSTLAEAIQEAESARAEELFYGQNELLLLGPGLQEKGMPECCRFLYDNSAGRPNMAVWGINRPASEQPLNEENAGAVLDSIRRLGERGEYHTYLYQLASAQGGGLLPLVRLSEESDVQMGGVALYKDGTPTARFTGSKTELAALLSGQTGTGQLRVEGESGPVTLTIRSPKLIYECVEQEDSMHLAIRLSGHVEQMTGENLPSSREQRRELLKQFNTQLEQMAQEVIRQSFAPGIDPFCFLSRFCNRNEQLAIRLEETETLYQPGSVEFSSALQLL